MNLAFLLHLYQPPTQTEASLKAIVHECYAPLIKLMKSRADIKFTLNVPLSLLEQLDLYGFSDVISGIKDLVASERVELTGSAAYHPLLTKTLHDFALKQIVLNEYGLGYYFGQRQGFEGEVSVMAKDIKGFFAPEMAINDNLVDVLDELKYEWLAVDENCLGKDNIASLDSVTPVVYKKEKSEVLLVVRNTALSNMISFKRDGEVIDVLRYIQELSTNGSQGVLVALDGEVFGHHNKEGIYFLSNFIDRLSANDIELSFVSELAKSIRSVPLSSVKESTWSNVAGASKKISAQEAIYPFWLAKGNEIQAKLWELFALTSEAFYNATPPKIAEGYENIAIWKKSDIAKLGSLGEDIQSYIELEQLVYKSMHSDQFWWASGKQVYDNHLYSPTLITNALNIYAKIADYTFMASVSVSLKTLIEETKRLIV